MLVVVVSVVLEVVDPEVLEVLPAVNPRAALTNRHFRIGTCQGWERTQYFVLPFSPFHTLTLSVVCEQILYTSRWS